MTTLLEHFSDRSKMVIFLTPKDPGRRGATAGPGQYVSQSRSFQRKLPHRFFLGFTTFCLSMNPSRTQLTWRCLLALSAF